MKKIALAILALCLSTVSVFAPNRTRSQITTDINTKFGDNAAGDITPQDLREVTKDIIDSVPTFTDEPKANAPHTHLRTDISDLSVFGASGGSASIGLVPSPGGTAGTTRFLREDATWQTVSGGGGGTVNSVALAAPGEFSVSGSPVTSSGTLSLAWQSAAAGLVFGRPTSGSGVPTFTSLTAAHISDSTTDGRNFLTAASVAAQQALLGLLSAAYRDVPGSGNASATQVVLGNDTRLTQYYDEKTYQGTWDFDENASPAAGWTTSISGTGSAVGPIDSEQGAYGIHQIATGTTATGRGSYFRSSQAVRFGVMSYISRWRIRIPTLSDSGERFILRIGFGDQVSVDNTDGAYFVYDEATSANWRICTANNGLRTINTTSIAVNTSWELLEVRVNAGGTSVEFFVDGVSAGSPITNNIPTGSGRTCGLLMHVIKSVGTTSRTILMDRVNITAVAP